MSPPADRQTHSSSPGPAGALARWFATRGGAGVVVLLLLVVLVGGLMTPIVAFDTDLWYHLADGRRIATTGEIPSVLDFSFLAPDQTWIDYFWGFQVVVFQVYQIAGYHGLVVLRALLFLAILMVIVDVLVSEASSNKHWLAVAAVLGCSIAVLSGRYELVRPHTVSYLLLAIFVLVLAKRPRAIVALPPLALVWVNVHGITYPVLLVACAALLANLVAARLAERVVAGAGSGMVSGAAGPARLGPLLALLLCSVAVLATPHGRALLPLPFMQARFANYYISELHHRSWGDLVRIDLDRFALPANLGLMVLLLLALRGLWRSRRSIATHPGAVILALGGIGLFVRGQRFQVELALMVLPLVREGLRDAARWSRTALVGVGLVVTLAFGGVWQGREAQRWAFPVAQVKLPVGVVDFLSRDPEPGRVMNSPNVGGYLLWQLPPRFRFAMDMKVPFVFDDEDFFLASGFFQRDAIFSAVIERYRPTYLMVPVQSSAMAERIAALAPDYTMVFFDDTTVLYADLRQRPRAPQLHAIDPYALHDGEVPDFSPERTQAIRAELAYVLAIFPTGEGANQLLAILENRAGNFAEAERAARLATEAAPGFFTGWLLVGDALQGQERWEEALAAYRRAVSLAGVEEDRRRAQRALGIALLRSGQPGPAYRALQQAIGLYNAGAPPADLELVATAALGVGDLEIAVPLLKLVLLSTPAEDLESRSRVESLLRTVDPAALPSQ